MECFIPYMPDQWPVGETELVDLGESESSHLTVLDFRHTIWDILDMLLLLLHIKLISVSQASWLRIRMPVNLGACLRKFGSSRDHLV